jgi:hypothetical protein
MRRVVHGLRAYDAAVRVPVLVGLGWLLLLAAWIGGNPPFAGADEEWHYLRSLGVSEGELVGKPAHGARLGANALQIAWTDQATRSVSVPAGLAPPSAGCYILQPRVPATCLDAYKPPPNATRQVTPVGTYEPLPYLLPAVAVGLAHKPAAALRLGRVASALLPVILLVAAIAALWSGTALSLAGVILAVTPMALFSASLLNGSGLEIAAAVCFAASLLRLTRSGDPPQWIWAAVAGAGALLSLSRSGSPVWMVLILAPILSLGGARRLRELTGAHRRAAIVTGAVLAVAVAANRAWEGTYGPHVELGLANALGTLRLTIDEWWHAASDLVGRFGYLETRVPLTGILAWFGLVLAVLATALWLGSRRERIVLALTTLGALILPMAFWLIQYRHTGFDLQGRQVLPVMIVVPLLSGEIIWRHHDRLSARVRGLLPGAVLLVAAAVQLQGWWIDARRSAVGTGGPLWFAGNPGWSPPTGWGLWIALAAAGAASLVTAAAIVVRASRSAHTAN